MSTLLAQRDISSDFDAAAATVQMMQGPEILARFERDLKAANCEVGKFENPDSVTTPAEYRAFHWSPGEKKTTFINLMRFVENSTDAQKKISRWHEGIHAIHANTVPATHFTPYNMGNLNIILSPASYILLNLLMERAAAAGVSMLGYLDGTPEIRKAIGDAAGTVEDFEEAMRANNYKLDVALNSVARESLMKKSNEYLVGWGKHGARADNEPLWLRNYYVWQALKEYHHANRFTYGDFLYDSPPPIFVRLGEEDVAQIGNILGLNAFGTPDNPDSFFVRNPTLTGRHFHWLNTLNQLHNIPDESKLPTLKEALSRYYGITPDEALKFSKAYKHGDPIIKPHGPESGNIVPFVLGTYFQPAPIAPEDPAPAPLAPAQFY